MGTRPVAQVVAWIAGALSALSASALTSYELLNPLFAESGATAPPPPWLPVAAAAPPLPPPPDGSRTHPLQVVRGDESRRLVNNENLNNYNIIQYCGNGGYLPSVYVASSESDALKISLQSNPLPSFVTFCNDELPTCCATTEIEDATITFVIPSGIVAGLHFAAGSKEITIDIGEASTIHPPPPPHAPPSPPRTFSATPNVQCCNASEIVTVRLDSERDDLCSQICASVEACFAVAFTNSECRLLEVSASGSCVNCTSVEAHS